MGVMMGVKFQRKERGKEKKTNCRNLSGVSNSVCGFF